MKVARFRLIFAISLFCIWLGYLGYLVEHEKAVVLSRSQLLLAEYVVKAEVKLNGKAPTTAHVLESFGKNTIPEKDFNLHLSYCELPDNRRLPTSGEETLLLPLIRAENGTYRVVAIPGTSESDQSRVERVYTWSPQVERQVREILEK